MAAHALCKASREGIGFSSVGRNDVRHLFAAAVPRRGPTLRRQAEEALGNIAAAMQEGGARGAIVHQAVFVADVGRIDECRRIIRDFYGRDLPATSYLPQPPCGGALLAIEAHGVGRGGSPVEVERVSEQLVIARHEGLAWVYCTPAAPPTPAAGVYEGATDALRRIRSLLGGAGVRFDRVVRTWLQLGGIVDDEGPAQRYQELNRARDDFYRAIPFRAGRRPAYPASTGIGVEGRAILMSALALATDRDDVRAVPLENPRQTAAYDYAASYSPRSPKFSRAMAVSCGAGATIYISGTASITGSETRHPGDVVAQTHETLDNIAALIAEANLRRHGLPGLGTTLDGLGLARVYLKREQDYAAVRAICARRLGELPTTYVRADVCRPELLVEIEGIAFPSDRVHRPRGAPLRPHVRPLPAPTGPRAAPAGTTRPRAEPPRP